MPNNKFIPKSGRLVQPRETTRTPESRGGLAIQDILPIAGGIAGAFIPGVGPILGPAIGAGLGKLAERGVSAARGEEVSLGQAATSALGESALFGALGGIGKLATTGFKAARTGGGILPRAAELITGAPRQVVKTTVAHPELVQEFKTGARGLPDIVSKLGRATKTMITKTRLDYKTGLEEITTKNASKVMKTQGLKQESESLLKEFGFPFTKKGIQLKQGPLIGEQVTRLQRMLNQISRASRTKGLDLMKSRTLVQNLRRLGKVSPTPENEQFLGLANRLIDSVRSRMVNSFEGLEALNTRYAKVFKDTTRLRKALGQVSGNPDTAESFIRSLLRKSTELTPQSRFASREMIKRLETETGENILAELEAYDAAQAATRPFQGAIGQPLVTARELMKKGVLRGAQTVGRVKQRLQLPSR